MPFYEESDCTLIGFMAIFVMEMIIVIMGDLQGRGGEKDQADDYDEDSHNR